MRVERNAGGLPPGERRRPRRGATVLYLSAGLMLGSSALAGEKITIVEATNTISLPKELKEVVVPRSGFLPSRLTGGESSQGPVLPHPGQPTLIRNPKLEEFLDRKKNWAFDSPNSLDRERTLEETFGIRDYEMSGFEKKTGSAVDRYFEKEADTEKPTRSSSRDMTSRDSLNPRRDLDPAERLSIRDEMAEERPGIIPELNPAPLFNWNMPVDPLSRMNPVLGRSSILPSSLNDPMAGPPTGLSPAAPDKTQPVTGSANDWTRLNSPLGRVAEPIINQPDPTRAFMNPIAARKAAAPPPESSQGRIGESFGFGNSSPLGSLPGRSVGDSFGFGQGRPAINTPAAKPAVPATMGTPLPQPKPAVLEIPRPRF